ncbi:MAG: hypothetical protein RMJ97_10670 [Raineya sp.]|nr:hypothetical protein [Raineya sp.]
MPSLKNYHTIRNTTIEFYLSSDNESLKIYKMLKQKVELKFQSIDLNRPYEETFGFLNFK